MNIMSRIAKPEDVGLDPARLSYIPDYFRSYVDRGKIAGFSTLVSRHGEIAHFEVAGQRDRERGLPMEKDTIFRIYSMTKPITSLALMMLYEEGHFQLNHPVSRYIPSFKKLQVWAGGTAEKYETKPCEREMTIRDLLTHTSGLTYGFMQEHPKKSGIMDIGDETSSYAQPPRFLSGGGGLTSTMMDYWRFCQMLLNGGELEGVRLCSPKTIEFMTLNHLPGGQTMKKMSRSAFSELAAEGAGFGLGFQVLIDPAEAQAIGSPGNFSWGGAASTYFWIDPEEDLITIFMTQLYPSSTYPFRPQLQQLVYGAITE